VAAAAFIVSAGCSTSNPNPPAARANTGHVDFYTDSSLGLSWEVKRGSESSGEMRTVFSKIKPVEGTTLRVEAPPGSHRFQVWISNQVTEGPQTVSVQVAEGKVTPVHVTLVPTRSASVETKNYEYRSTARASRRVTKLSTDQSPVYRIEAVAGDPQAYRPKEEMPYWSAKGN
jgi:hypothetical protein